MVSTRSQEGVGGRGQWGWKWWCPSADAWGFVVNHNESQWAEWGGGLFRALECWGSAGQIFYSCVNRLRVM